MTPKHIKYLLLILLLTGCSHTNNYSIRYNFWEECVSSCATSVERYEDGSIQSMSYNIFCDHDCRLKFLEYMYDMEGK